MIELANYVRMVMLQFSFSNPNVIPQILKRVDCETPEQLNECKGRASGLLVIKPTENCSIEGFLEGLKVIGYKMVDAFSQERINPNIPGKKYYMVRFSFVRREFVEDLSDDFEVLIESLYAALIEMCRAAMWRVRVFKNPFYLNGREIPNQYALSINLEARKPLFDSNGQPVMVWQKNENGKRVGNAPIPLKPDYRLDYSGAVVKLVKYSS